MTEIPDTNTQREYSFPAFLVARRRGTLILLIIVAAIGGVASIYISQIHPRTVPLVLVPVVSFIVTTVLAVSNWTRKASFFLLMDYVYYAIVGLVVTLGVRALDRDAEIAAFVRSEERAQLQDSIGRLSSRLQDLTNAQATALSALSKRDKTHYEYCERTYSPFTIDRLKRNARQQDKPPPLLEGCGPYLDERTALAVLDSRVSATALSLQEMKERWPQEFGQADK